MKDEHKPRFCSDCGMSLVKLDTACTSRNCEDCGKEIFYVRRGENGGIRIEAGENFHFPQLTLSLNPNDSGRFFRPGLESFLKQLFLEEQIKPDAIVNRFKQQEIAIDDELKQLDCIQHCDLETQEGVDEAAQILQKEGLMVYFYNLARSGGLRNCYEAIENGDAVTAAYCCHMANIYKEFSLLEDEHFKEIIWLGYNCYFDLVKNEGATPDSVKEMRLIKAAGPKIKSLDSELIYALVKDGLNIGNRIGIIGVTEETLKTLLEHELDKRNKTQEDQYKEREIKIKENDNKLKLWGLIFTIANAIILALYKNWFN